MDLGSEAVFFVDSQYNSWQEALAKCTHMAVAAHPDDLEIMAGHGIVDCYNHASQSFIGVIVCDGAPSELNESEILAMISTRQAEQKKAALLGRYGAIIFLNFSSADITSGLNKKVIELFGELLSYTDLQVLYTHNPMDRHQTHVAVVNHLVHCLNHTIVDQPLQFLGCEVWGGLDWLNDESKVLLTLNEKGMTLVESLIRCHQSQHSENRDYGAGVRGRMLANSVFADAYNNSTKKYGLWAVDLKPLIGSQRLSWEQYLKKQTQVFHEKLIKNLKNFL